MSDAQQLRARKRYRVLLREAHELEQRGLKDQTVILELQKLEHEYPALKDILKPVKRVSSVCSNNTMAGAKQEQLSDDATQSILTTSTSTTPMRDASVGSSVSLEPLSCGEFNQRGDELQKIGRQEVVLSLGRGVGFVFSVLGIWNEVRLPSSLSISSYLLILALAIGMAVFHNKGVDPYAPLGRLISPGFLNFLVHIWNLFSVYLKSSGRISKAMLFVYFVFDFLPSLVFVFVVYVLACIGLKYV